MGACPPEAASRGGDRRALAHGSAPDEQRGAVDDHVIVLGFGAGAHLLARVLREAHIRYVVVELNAETVNLKGRIWLSVGTMATCGVE